MNATLNPASGYVVALAKPSQENLEQLGRFLPKDEPLIWTGAPQLSRLLLRAITRTAMMTLIASVGIYFAAQGISMEDLCGAQSSRACRKLYVFPWFGLVAASVYIPFLWLSLLFHTSGLLSEFYGLTNRQALKLRSNSFDRFQSVKLETLKDQRIGVRGRFGTLTFGWLSFLCLSHEDREAALRTLEEERSREGHGQPASRGATP